MGITFKEDCPDIRNTKIIDLINELEDWSIKYKVVDPWAIANEVKIEYGIELENIENIHDCDALIVAVGHNQFRKLTAAQLKEMCSNEATPVIADLKSIYNKNELESNDFSVIRL
jgi:UDP-N-acetyl-D-galactosamine dehydrogenase